MATEAQYACFKDIFDRESVRQEQLIERGKVFLSIITLYLGLLGVAVDEIVPEIRGNWLAVCAYLASFAAFLLSIALVIRALGIYKYVYPTDPERVVLQIEDDWPMDSEFFDDRIAELAAAFKTNHPANERRANLLKLASFSMLAGIGLQAIVLSSLVFL